MRFLMNQSAVFLKYIRIKIKFKIRSHFKDPIWHKKCALLQQFMCEQLNVIQVAQSSAYNFLLNNVIHGK